MVYGLSMNPKLHCTFPLKYLKIQNGNLTTWVQTIWNFRNKIVVCTKVHKLCFYIPITYNWIKNVVQKESSELGNCRKSYAFKQLKLYETYVKHCSNYKCLIEDPNGQSKRLCV